MSIRRVLVSLSLLSIACGPQTPEPPPVPFEGVTVRATGPVQHGSVGFLSSSGTSDPAAMNAMTMSIAQLELRVDLDAGRAVLRRFELPLGDVTISPEALPPSGLKLLQLKARLIEAERLDVLARSDREVELASLMGLRLDWSLELPDGSPYRLGPLKFPNILAEVHIFDDAEGQRVELRFTCDGVCWSVPGLLTIRDIDARAMAPVTIEPLAPLDPERPDDRGPVTLL